MSRGRHPACQDLLLRLKFPLNDGRVVSSSSSECLPSDMIISFQNSNMENANTVGVVQNYKKTRQAPTRDESNIRHSQEKLREDQTWKQVMHAKMKTANTNMGGPTWVTSLEPGKKGRLRPRQRDSERESNKQHFQSLVPSHPS